MDYEVFSMVMLDGTEQEFVTLYIDEGNAKTFPADETNEDYLTFLASLEPVEETLVEAPVEELIEEPVGEPVTE